MGDQTTLYVTNVSHITYPMTGMTICISVMLVMVATGLAQDGRATGKNKLNWWKWKCFESLPNSSVSIAIVIYMYTIFSTFCGIMGWSREREGQGTKARKYHLQSQRWENMTSSCKKLWLPQGFFFCELSWGMDRGQNHLGSGIWTQQHQSAFADLVVVLFPPNYLSPLLHQYLLPVAWIEVRLCLVTAVDTIFRSGKSFCFHFQPEIAGGRARKIQEEKWIESRTARSYFWFCIQFFFQMYSLSVIETETLLQKGAYESDAKHLLVLGAYLHEMTLAEVLMFIILSATDDRKKMTLSVLLQGGLAGSFFLMMRVGFRMEPRYLN